MKPGARLALQTALGLAVGLGITEAAFRHRDGHAYPLINVYEPDARRGVRLAPGSVTVVGGPGEKATRVRVNQDGYRGADWPPPSSQDVLVIGDSLSFGLGVEEEEALPQRLHATLPDAPAVLDASVPTYGPPEYLATMEQMISRRHPGTVVIVVNLINDLAEIDHPNAARHAALDGYAARLDPGAPPRASSPLRTRFIQRSHAAFALWRFARTREAEHAAIEPEPGPNALLPLALRVAAASRAFDEHHRDEARRAAARADVEQEMIAAERGVVQQVRANRALVAYNDLWRREWDAYLQADGTPGDETFPISYGGCAPPPPRYGRGRYASYVRYAGSRIRRDVEEKLQDLARGILPERAREIRDAFARRAAARERLAASSKDAPLPPPPAPAPLPITPFLADARSLAAAPGARLVVVAAPLDAQVSIEARARRDLSAIEAAALDALTAEIAAAATAAGAIGVDATPALKQAGAAAFLADGHLSRAGHDIVARAIAAAIAPHVPAG